MFQRVTANIGGVQMRREVLEGKQYLVVPTVMLTEGVHVGSDGPLLYTALEMSKNPLVWNHKPIVVYHPTIDGDGISACSPSVLEKQKAGIILNTVYDNRLRTESWLDIVKLRQVDNRVLADLEAAKTVEVSTGLFHDPDFTPGEWQGQKYRAIVRNIQPDHLAILPDEIGACSVVKGAGLLRNSEPITLLHQQLRDALVQCHKLPGTWYIADIYADRFIWNEGGRFFSLLYNKQGDTINLIGQPQEVDRVSEYKPRKIIQNGEPPVSQLSTPPGSVAGLAPGVAPTVPAPTPVAVLAPNLQPQVNPLRKDQVDKLILGHGWAETDREFLLGLSEDGFAKITKYSAAKATSPAPAPAVPVPAPIVPQPVPAPATPTVLSAQQYIEQTNMPPEIREVLRNGLAATEAERKQLVTIITNNKNNLFTKEWLMQVATMDQLRGMARLAGGAQQPVNNYGGQAEVPMFGVPVQNAEPGDVPVLPPIKWD